MKTVKITQDLTNARATILTRANVDLAQGNSPVPEVLLTQLRCCREFALDRKMKVFGELFITGKDVLEDLDTLLLFLKSESMTHLLVTSADRLSKNHEDAMEAIEKIKAIGVTICFTRVADRDLFKYFQ